MFNDFFMTIWQSHWFGVLLWSILAAVLFAPALNEWWQQKSRFDLLASKQLFRAVYFLYFGVPSFYYLLYPRSFAYVSHFDSTLKVVLLLAITGALSFYVGYWLPIRWQWRLPDVPWSLKRLLAIVSVATVISATSFAVLMRRVGGICYYFTHLGQTNELMAGNTYFLWGILLLKSSALLLLMYVLSTKAKSKWLWLMTAVYVFLSLLLLSFMGSRILLVVFIFELLILIHYLYRRLNVFWILGVLLIIVVVVVGILGEFRNFSWIAPNACSGSKATIPASTIKKTTSPTASSSAIIKPQPTPTSVDAGQYVSAFGHQLEKVSSDKQLLADRYIDNYFDSVLTTMMTYENTPRLLRYQYGLGYVQVIFQPLPSHIRPNIMLPTKGYLIFSSGPGYSRIQSMLAEAYVNFGLFGIILIPGLLGLFAQCIYTLRRVNETSPWATVLYAIGIGGLMVWIRGYFIGHTVLFLIDLLPMLAFMAVFCFKRKG